MNWSTTAFVFPGQGSQQVGMAADLASSSAAAAKVFAHADRILGMEFTEIMREGPSDVLDDTYNTQPALYIAGVATLRALEERAEDPFQPLAVAGHSLGEFTALTAAGALSFEAGLRLVRERGRLMREAGEQHPGAMAALLGLEVADARAVCAEASTQAGKPVVVANDNCPGQIVISGDETALDLALPLAKARGAKRAVKLAVSVAAHSPLMAQAADSFAKALAETAFDAPRVPVIANLSAAPIQSAAEIRSELSAQLTGAVRWTETIRALRVMGATHFLEIGPKDVLTGLLKRIDKDAVGIPLNSSAAVVALEMGG